MELNRVWAIGRKRDSYIRFYPNPGIGLCIKMTKNGPCYRVALSWKGGVEFFKPHPIYVWQRKWSKWSRVKRPGALG